jgi:hypothetical protein
MRIASAQALPKPTAENYRNSLISHCAGDDFSSSNA